MLSNSALPKVFGLFVTFVVALVVAVPGSSAHTVSAPPVPPPGLCNLLQNSEVLANISGTGERVLRRKCVGQPNNGQTAAPDSAALDSAAPDSAAKQGSSGPRRALEPGEVVQDTSPAEINQPFLGVDLLVNNRATDTFSHVTQSETSAAVFGSTVLVGYNDSGQFNATGDFTGYSRSTNGGATWTDKGPPTTPLNAIQAVFGDPVLFADRTRNAGETAVFYFANLAENAAGTSLISVHRSINGGNTWQRAASASPLAGAAEFQDKEWLAVDTFPGFGQVYACWRRFGGANGIRFSRSTDQGVTFTEMAANLSGNASNVQGCQVWADFPFTRLYAAWLDTNFVPPVMRARVSTDNGLNFGAEVTIGQVPFAETTTNCGGTVRNVFLDTQAGNTSRAIRSTPFPSLTTNPSNGDAYAVWHRASLPGGSSADIAFSKSTDGGATWSAPVRINSVVTGVQFFPSIAVNAVGTQIKVMYYSTQNDATNRLLDVYEVISTDGGTTWGAPIRVTGSSFDRPVTNPNFDTFINACYMGDYNSVTAPSPGLGGNDFYLAWGDNHLDADPNTAGVQPDPDIRFDRNRGVAGCYNKAERLDANSVRITWRDLSDYETSWRIFRKLPATNVYVLIATLGANSTTFTDLAIPTPTSPSTDLPEYQVAARNASQSQLLLNSLCE